MCSQSWELGSCSILIIFVPANPNLPVDVGEAQGGLSFQGGGWIHKSCFPKAEKPYCLPLQSYQLPVPINEK